MIDAISSISSISSINTLGATSTANTQTSSITSDFNQWLVNVNNDVNVAQTSFEKLAKGEDISVHKVMMDIESSKMQLELMVEVRNKLLEGYQEILRMQL
ncbi:MAG: flagellar hook-basal body complex protein FliE [Saccharospirillaceae bacterium]|nr:flagellar hook-basal body complex protein FliE [Pseudomonadales bacterium]NRB79732.1 flagellar hook-basal body complex protein FliE [Saccharospirillaceae bacterium]